MTNRQLQRAVAVATGESLHEIRRRGFSPVAPPATEIDAEQDDLPPQVVDWDALALERGAFFRVH